MKKILTVVFLLFAVVAGWLFVGLNNPTITFKNYSSFETMEVELIDKATEPLLLGDLIFASNTPTTIAYQQTNYKKLTQELLNMLQQRTVEEAKVLNSYYTDVWSLPTSRGTLNDLLVAGGKSGTMEIIKTVMQDTDVLVANEQLRYDVARPYQTNLRLLSEIIGSKRPSYPSEIIAQLKAVEYVMRELKYEDEVLYQAINQAVAGVYIYGLNTKADGDYADVIVRTVIENAKKNHPSFKDFVATVREREWVGAPQTNGTTSPHFELSVYSPNIATSTTGISFEGIVINTATTASPEMIVELQVDQYADGSIDARERFTIPPVSNMSPEPLSFFKTAYRSGQHQFRFILDPDNYYWGNERKLNNVTAWQEFVVE